MKTFEKLPLASCVDVYVSVVGMLANNVYLIDDGTTSVIVDPGTMADDLIDAIRRAPRTPAAILLTHSHSDHTGAAEAIRTAFDLPVYASEIDGKVIAGIEASNDPLHRKYRTCQVDHFMQEGQVMEIGTLKFASMLTPGHTTGGMCWLIEPEAEQEGRPVLVAGDTLFDGSYGRTDLGDGDRGQMKKSLLRLSELPDEVIVLPGHGSLTSIKRLRPLFQAVAQGNNW